MKYLALGDSYTIGEAVEQALTFPFQLSQSLISKGISLDDPIVVAKTGWTTDELESAIRETDLHPPYQLVTLLIGVNNQYRGRSADNFKEEFLSLLQMAIDFSGNENSRVFVLSIPDWSVTPFGIHSGRDREQIAQEIDLFNSIIEKVCSDFEIDFTNITPLTRKAEYDKSLTAEDGLHPSDKLYKDWVALLAPKVYQSLNSIT